MDPTILIFDSPAEAAAACGDRSLEVLEEARTERGSATIAVSGGNTPRLMFEIMAKRDFDWNGVDIFQVDERCVPPDHAQSNYRMLRESLLAVVRIEEGRVYRVKGELAPEEASRQYAEEIRRYFQLSADDLPVFDLIQRGMGPDAHTASLFPGEPLIEDWRNIAAAVRNAKLEPSMQHRVTLLRGVLEKARSTFCLVTGEDKAEPLRRVLKTDYDPVHLPAQIASTNTVWFVDKSAASKL